MSEYHPVYYARRRAATLDRYRRLRRVIALGDRIVDGHLYLAAEGLFILRKQQMLLVYLRIWRETGVYPRDDN